MSRLCSDSPADHSTRIVKNKQSSEPVAGVFAKASRKPTNHSKFTGKCSKQMCVSCRKAPASKAKNKLKGRHKFGTIIEDEAVCRVYDSFSMDDEFSEID